MTLFLTRILENLGHDFQFFLFFCFVLFCFYLESVTLSLPVQLELSLPSAIAWLSRFNDASLASQFQFTIITIHFLFADVPSQAIQGSTAHKEEEPIKSFRTHFTACQRRELEKTFSQSQYISPQKRQSLSLQLGISAEIIQVHPQASEPR